LLKKKQGREMYGGENRRERTDRKRKKMNTEQDAKQH
jgi:hypothetical protein